MSVVVSATSHVDVAVAQLDAWLDTMRGPDGGGYGGPVAHWWQQSLLFTGPAMDWRYEGIIAGYLQLWVRTGEERWLRKACRAGDDLVAGQLETGHFVASAFEINPASAGTPHEAACDAGLLRLALALRRIGSAEWQKYGACAQRNLESYYLVKLWDAQTRSFRDSPSTSSFVPNKAATACEALFLLAELTGDGSWVEQYALPNIERILQYQVRGTAGRLDGAIAQNSLGDRVVEKYFPIYNARCVPALVAAYTWTKSERYLDAARRIMLFVERWALADGSLPTVVYANSRSSRFPAWFAALGDVLRAVDLLRPYAGEVRLGATEAYMLSGQDTSGGLQTATGFGGQASGRPDWLPDARDLLHVVGWCDKAFRYLTAHVSGTVPPAERGVQFEQYCIFRGRFLRMVEDSRTLAFRSHNGRLVYLWEKGRPWATTSAPEFWMR